MLTDYLLSRGYGIFFGGWTQFGAAFAVAFMIMLAFGRPFIRAMHRWQKDGQPISENVPESHRKKAGTPTMGGILMLIAILIGAIMFMPMESYVGWVAILSLVMFGSIGFADDYKKIKSQSKKASNGLSPLMRLVIEGVCVVVLAYLINLTMAQYNIFGTYSITLPFRIPVSLNLWHGLFYFVFAYFVICGSANATNITDGLDGMLSKLYMPVLVVLVIALYGATRTGHTDTALAVYIMDGARGLYPVLGAVFGAVLGFLWFNAKPASIFMGDVGSLALGGFMGTVAMLLRSEIVMAIAAGMMILILLSSFVQTMFFKITRITTGTGRRVFLRAPLHHHFEELGWAETKIVDRFFIASIVFAGIALAVLKFA